MKKYTKPELEMKKYEPVDIIAASPLYSVYGFGLTDDDYSDEVENYNMLF